MSFKQFQSIFYPAFDIYGLIEWTLEKMLKMFFCPKCAHQKKLKDKSGWCSVYTTLLFRARYTEQKDANGVIWGSGQVQMKIFEQGCQTCGTYRSGCLDQDDKSGWCSVYTTLLFRARYTEQKDANGVIWGSGQVQMKIFEQGCQTCGTYSSGCLDQEGIEQAFYWLHIWLLKKFYNVEIYGDDCSDQPKDERFSRGPHDSKR
ncbi:unnamed protein product, partial [Rotaria sp. Silwood1]